jgi:hypothetical protein
MLRRCDKGHLTGFRHCATCGSDAAPFDWLNAQLSVAAPLKEPKLRKPRKRTVGIAVPGWSMFREWRERWKRRKAAARKRTIEARF